MTSTESLATANMIRTVRRLEEAKAIKGLQGITARRIPPKARNHSRSHRSIR